MNKNIHTLYLKFVIGFLFSGLFLISQKTSAQCYLTCNDLVQVSLDQNCEAEIMPDDILEGNGCPNGNLQVQAKINGVWVPASGNFVADADNINQTLQVRVRDLNTSNACGGQIHVEDKWNPSVTCSDVFINCAVTNYDPAYLQDVLDIEEAYPDVVENCTAYTLTHIDSYFDVPCNGSINGISEISAYVIRKWTAVDASGNSATCNQYIYFERKHAFDLVLPANVTVDCENPVTDPNTTGVPHVFEFGQEYPIWPSSASCELTATYEDQILTICDGTYKILRTWTILDWCLPNGGSNPVFYVQIIKVEDTTGPIVDCPENITVGTNPNDCQRDYDLPDIIVSDNCSRLKSFEAQWDDYNGIGHSRFGSFSNFPGNNLWDRDTLAVMGYADNLGIGNNLITYIITDDCGNTTVCQFTVTVQDDVPPTAACDQTTTIAIGPDDPNDCYVPSANGCDYPGVTYVKASTFDDGSYDECGGIKFTIRRMPPYSDCILALNNVNGHPDCDDFFPDSPSEFERAIMEGDSIKFYCCEVGTTQTVILRVYQLELDGSLSIGWDGEPIYNECMIQVEVQDKLKPECTPPAPVTVTCENFDPSLWAYGKAFVKDNCCLDSTKVYQGQKGLTHTVNYSQFDTLCNKGTLVRTFRAFDCHGFSSQCTQRIVVNYEQDYFVKFPNDVIVTVCDGTGNYGEPTFFGKDCELLGVSHSDEVFTVVPDACFKIERTWKIINWCTYDPAGQCINVPNPNPNSISNHPSNLPGPIVSPIQTSGDPWKSTIVKIHPGDPQSTNYSIYYDPNANCYTYKQIIKIIDTQAPEIQCPQSPVTICDVTSNDAALWNASYWWDNVTGSHDLCEAPADICITATDLCSGSNINIEYLLFLDLDGDGSMETMVNSTQLGSQPGGLGWNNVLYGNVNGAGTSRQFDFRNVPTNQKWGFAIQETTSGTDKTACVKFNTAQSQNTFVTPQLPYGKHKIKWIVSDGCGNEKVCEYDIIIKDCKAPTVVCLNGLSVNIMPTGMITLWASDFLQYSDDNCTPGNLIKFGIRKSGTGTGFPVDAQGNPITSVTFDCTELGTQPVELWAIDLAGNADYCETTVLVQDNIGSCGSNPGVVVSGALKTEMQQGVEEAEVLLTGSPGNGAPDVSTFDMSDNLGTYWFINSLPYGSNFTLTPAKDDNPLNGITTYDLVLISKHILGIEPLGSPYKMIAADANKSNSITTFDIVEIRKLILGIYQSLPGNDSWRFIDNSYVFPNPSNPFQEMFPENKSVADMQA
ncbi:MAG: HYR domain-containing protein, partial [Saprospiraceae bacterium]|nr:HYR domain-containing protein [Saprospiraceae bacterium]